VITLVCPVILCAAGIGREELNGNLIKATSFRGLMYRLFWTMTALEAEKLGESCVLRMK
jgi:hypothetical protein